MYYLVKTNVRTEKVCNRLWSFERFPNKMLRAYDNVAMFSSNRENCLAACLNERRFVCRAAEFNSITFQCHLSDADRRTVAVEEFVDAPGIDYFENACLDVDQVCSGVRTYDIAKLGPSQDIITHYVDLNYYPDKELLVSSKSECLRACTMDRDFLCRSVLFKPTESIGQNSCSLYHVDHVMFPDGAQIFKSMSSQLPLLDTGETVGFYMEANCAGNSTNDSLSKFGAVTKRPVLTTSKIEHRSTTKQPGTNQGLQGLTKEGYDDGACDSYGVCYDVSIQCTDQKIIVDVKTSRPFHGRIYAMGRSETCNTAVKNGQNFKLDLPLAGQECNTQSMGGVYSNTVVLQHHNVVLTKADKVYNVRCTYETSSKNISFGMMPVSDIDMRDPDNGLAQQITASPEAPVPRIMIFGVDGNEATTVRIGDKLTFKIEIPGNTPYGIFARSCVAMAKDARSTFEIIDDRGCPVDPAIFPRFRQVDTALESNYEAFRFTGKLELWYIDRIKYRANLRSDWKATL
ncbi:hypothetical protein BIW11_13349 [Tropilaelaps mercedesae]|uniref:Cuticlin-1-like n=1 Tax=Tropilaelaps mercedesae TaxID=418985 RepID=A0A1V9X236_9ACAR|nr:hypothetical protein BIW11_13349 [Tropilaelaps mercedesae]